MTVICDCFLKFLMYTFLLFGIGDFFTFARAVSGVWSFVLVMEGSAL